jgi:1A family penicillin-binding protein
MSWKDVWQNRISRISNNAKYPLMNYRSPYQKIKRIKLLSKIAFLGFWGILLSVFIFIFLFIWYARELPSPDKVVRNEGFATKIYDRNEKLLYDVYENQRRTPVELNDVPLYLRQATISVEDKDFYTHGGFDPKGYFRQIYNVIQLHQIAGGSTITQQLVKNAILTNERTITRKIKEFILAIQIERKYSKDQILKMYLNEVPYGSTAFGVESAAELYFNKKVGELNLVESAFLAGLVQRPSVYSPFSSTPTAYVERTKHVLQRMYDDGKITKDLQNEAVKQLADLKFSESGSSFQAPHFIMYVKKLLIDRYGENMVEQGGLKVTTTLDLDLQNKAQTIVADEIAKVEKYHITNGAAMVMDPKTGEILVMVGSKNYDDPNYDGKVNVTVSSRQPGSAIKPVTYATAFKKGLTPATMIMDVKTSFPGGDKPEYVPVNYDGKFRGPVQIREALASSLNIPAVKVLAKVGIKEMMQQAFDMGLTTLEPTSENLSRVGLSVTLGGGEVRLIDLVSAYSAFANTGLKIEPIAILKVTDKNGKILEDNKPVTGRRVLTPEQSYLISNILSDSKARLLTFSPGSYLEFNDRQVAVKTGTTNDKRDNWAIGWSPSFIAGVWAGNNDNTPMVQVSSGVSGASPIWRKIMNEALKLKPKEDFPVPENIVTAEVDTISGYRSHDGFSSKIESFIKGIEPKNDDPIHAKIKVCRGSGNLATPIDILRGDYEEKEYFVFKEDDPFVGADGINKWQKGIDDWIASQSDSRYRPPTAYCDSNNNQLDFRITSPSDRSQVGSSFRVAVEPITLNEIISVEIYIDGVKKENITSTPYDRDFTYNDPGTHTIKIVVNDSKGNRSEKEIKIGVNVPWDWSPSPTPPVPTPTSTH